MKRERTEVKLWRKVFLYSKLIESNTDRRHMIQNFSISLSTLQNIKKELDSNIIPWNRQAMQSKRQIMKSSFINKSIRRYTSITKHPYTARDISTFLFKKHKVRVNPRWIRSILTKSMRMSNKLGKSRLVNYNEVNAAQMKVLFSIKISKIINDYDALINVD